MIKGFTILCIGITLFLSACGASTARLDVRGDWQYTMTAAGGNTYDTGHITFSGNSDKGTYKQTNLYAVEYKGEFTMAGNTLKLTGDETWVGDLTDANTMSGKWSHTDGVNGTFTAKRK